LENQKTAQLQAQRAKDDSIRIAQIRQIKETEILKSSLEDSLASYKSLLGRQQNLLIQLRTTIYTANDDMTQIKAFHLGRLPQTREMEVRNQELKIQSLIMQQSSLQEDVQHSTNKISQISAEIDNTK
jgi:hypothetical protein